jgi:hypothetical protein
VVFSSLRKRSSPAPAVRPPFPSDPTLGVVAAGEAMAAVELGDFGRFRAALVAPRSWADRECVLDAVAGMKGRPPALDYWVEATGGDPLALLARGAHGVGWAWQARTGALASGVSRQQFELFWDRLRMAEADLYAVAAAQPGDPLCWSHLINAGTGLQVPQPELTLRLQEALRRAPGLFFVHTSYLQAISAKWGGSHEQMFGYARSVASQVGPGSALEALVAIAHIERALHERSTFYFSGEVSAELHALAAKTFTPGFPDDASGVLARNVMAVAMAKCRDLLAAQQQLVALRGRLSAFPWHYEADAAALLAHITAG